MKLMRCVVLIFALVTSWMPVNAAIGDTDRSSGAQSLSEIDLSQKFRAERRRIERDMAPEGKYGGLSETEKDQVRDALQIAHVKIGDSGRLADLSPADQVAVFNELERVNVLLARAPEGTRKICERVLRVGSKIPETVCYTEDEMRAQSRGARGAKEYLEQRGRPGFDDVGGQ